MADVKRMTATFAAIMRPVPFRWWGGIGCRVSFFMMAVLVLVAALAGAFFFLEGEKNLDREIRGRAMYVARELAALTAVDIITGNRLALYKKLPPPFAANEEVLSGGTLLYLMMYNHDCDLLIGNTATDVFFNNDTYFYMLPSGRNTINDDVVLRCDLPRRAPLILSARKTASTILHFR